MNFSVTFVDDIFNQIIIFLPSPLLKFLYAQQKPSKYNLKLLSEFQIKKVSILTDINEPI